MLRRGVFRCCAIQTRDVQRVTAWFVHGQLNLDKLESQLREAHLPSVRRLTPTTANRRTAPRDDLLIFTVDPNNHAANGVAGPLPLLDTIRQDCPECMSDARKSFFVFRDGAVVGWNAGTRDMSALVAETLDAKPTTPPVSETLKFSVGDGSLGDSDIISVENPGDETLKLPFSYALAQSLKIDVVDSQLRPILIDAKRWQKDLGRTGQMTCGVKNLRVAKARLLAVYDDMDFGADIQTTPKLFWMPEYQQLRNVYKAARSHLEIDGRLEVLEDRAETVQEALDYLNHEVHTETNEFLTWVIIILIAIEILLALLHNDVVVACAGTYFGAGAASASATTSAVPDEEEKSGGHAKAPPSSAASSDATSSSAKKEPMSEGTVAAAVNDDVHDVIAESTKTASPSGQSV
jgi:uncharacterized Rmd1/YagE family protein